MSLSRNQEISSILWRVVTGEGDIRGAATCPRPVELCLAVCPRQKGGHAEANLGEPSTLCHPVQGVWAQPEALPIEGKYGPRQPCSAPTCALRPLSHFPRSLRMVAGIP